MHCQPEDDRFLSNGYYRLKPSILNFCLLFGCCISSSRAISEVGEDEVRVMALLPGYLEEFSHKGNLTSVSFAFTHTYTLVKTNIFPHGIFEK